MHLRSRLPLCLSLVTLLGCADEPAPLAASSPKPAQSTQPKQPVQAPPAAAPPAPEPAACVEQDLEVSLTKVAGVLNVERADCGKYVLGEAKCFTFTFAQKLDHANAGDMTTFAQHGRLIHRSCGAPTTIVDNGYSLARTFYEMEPSTVFATNTIELEHRFQGASLPVEKDRRWPALNIENGAADTHDVIAAFKKLYRQNWVSTGASKGGITAVYHRFLFPNDVDGTVAYVAPASRAREDVRYQERLDSSAFPADCVAKLHAYQTGALGNRRAAFISTLINEYSVPAPQADYTLEVFMARFDWGFWQSGGSCAALPGENASDQVYLAYFKKDLGPGQPSPLVSPATDEETSGAALSYEWAWQQGFALQVGRHLTGVLRTTAARDTEHAAYFKELLPNVTLPAYDGSLTERARDWVRTTADRLVLVYGELDPWSGGALDAPTQASSGRYFAPGAHHGAHIQNLTSAEQAEARMKVAAMYGRAAKTDALEALRSRAEDPALQTHVRIAREAIMRHEALNVTLRR